MDIKVFDRIEKKCLITKKQKQHILAVIKKHMQKDEHFESQVFNAYLDTDNFDLIIQSIEQPVFKEKVRARSYGGYDNVYIELKTKLCGKENNVGYKRRICISKRDYGKFLKGDLSLVEAVSKKSKSVRDIQIAKELDYLVTHFNLKPKILVFYERQSYQGEQNLRITFDEHLKYRTKNISFNTSRLDKEYFKDDRNIILEIKAHGYLPLWLVQALSQEKIFPQQFSKVGKIYQTIRKETNV